MLNNKKFDIKEYKVVDSVFCEIDESLLKAYKVINGPFEDQDIKFDSILLVKCKNNHIYIASETLRNEFYNRKKHTSLKKRKESLNLKKTIIIDKEQTDLGKTIKQICPRCGNDLAYLFEMPPMYGDEDNVIKYRCTKCHFTYSDNGKIT